MVNKTLLPPAAAPGKTPKPFKNPRFSDLARLSLRRWRTAGLGEPERFARIRETAWESLAADRSRGEPPMENTLLIGLSRQVMLERQMDVVANNVANVNTNGFKADRSLFQEYLMPGAHEDNFVGARPPRQLRPGPRHLPRFRARPRRADQEPARRRDRRRRLPRGADAGRRALHPRRRPADQQSGPARHRVGLSGARHLRPDRVPADRQGDHHRRRRQRHRARRHRPHRLGPRQAAAGHVSPTRRSW